MRGRYRMTSQELLSLLEYPREWDSYTRYFPPNWFSDQRVAFKSGEDAEHLRYASLLQLMKQYLHNEERPFPLAGLLQLIVLDPDQLMATSAVTDFIGSFPRSELLQIQEVFAENRPVSAQINRRLLMLDILQSADAGAGQLQALREADAITQRRVLDEMPNLSKEVCRILSTEGKTPKIRTIARSRLPK